MLFSLRLIIPAFQKADRYLEVEVTGSRICSCFPVLRSQCSSETPLKWHAGNVRVPWCHLCPVVRFDKCSFSIFLVFLKIQWPCAAGISLSPGFMTRADLLLFGAVAGQWSVARSVSCADSTFTRMLREWLQGLLLSAVLYVRSHVDGSRWTKRTFDCMWKITSLVMRKI